MIVAMCTVTEMHSLNIVSDLCK